MRTPAGDAARFRPEVLSLGLVLCLGVGASCTRPAEPVAAARVRSADYHLEPESETVSGRVADRATLRGLLESAQLRPQLVPAMVSLAGSVIDLRRVKAGHAYRLERTFDGLVRRFEYDIDEDYYLRILGPSNRQPEELTVELVPFEKTRTTVSVEGTVSKSAPSLFEAMEVAGEKAELSLALAEIFGGEIDFNTELQPDDRFRLVFEKVFREGQFSSYGPVLAAEFVNGGRVLKAVRFTVPGAKPDYFDEEGRSLRRFFLASPLKFAAPVTSKFSKARLHPILRIVRPHLGVDYKAPAGSAVVAVANGTVMSAGWSGEAGRLVHLRHASGYETLYMHLSSISVRAGQHVSQSDLIGRVGTSGMSTGPHLDYRVKKNGGFVNPLRIQQLLPPGEPVPPAFRAQFQAERDRAFAVLAAAAPVAASADREAAGSDRPQRGGSRVLDTPSRLQVSSQDTQSPALARGQPTAIVTLCAARPGRPAASHSRCLRSVHSTH